ncbi:hypothetical protein CAC42_3033 [Sphaceloma murrayae]|uniref:Uncharacterized protein n=1 Tax=Sphaceloma murrayae TaxID=2082308 RepID=A0A2K1QRC7_9PEZI|nr:hypothetical protein CAC42_3033 [Sphaceloma murrayae]
METLQAGKDSHLIAGVSPKTPSANQAVSRIRRSVAQFAIRKYLDQAHDLDEIDLKEPLPDLPRYYPSAIDTMIKHKTDQPAGQTDREEDFEIIRAAADDQADIRDLDTPAWNDLTSSFVDIDGQSESGQTAETSSISGRSDGETASIRSDGDYAEETPLVQRGSQLMFPDPNTLPSLAARQIASDSMIARGVQAERRDTQDDLINSIDQSEATIKGGDEPETAHKTDTQTELEPIHLQSCLQDVKAFFNQHKLHIDDVLPGLSALNPRRIAGFLVATLLSLVLGSLVLLPFYLWEPRSIDARTDMMRRHTELRKVLNNEGLTSWEGKDIQPVDILSYPKTFVLGDQESRGAQYTFQQGVKAKFAGHDQLFVSLPRGKHCRQYLTKPKINVRHWTQPIAIIEQRDLIDGLTYLKLALDGTEKFVDIDVKAGHVSTTVHASNRAPGSAVSPKKIEEFREASRRAWRGGKGVLGALKLLRNDLSYFAEETYASSWKVASEGQAMVRKPLSAAQQTSRAIIRNASRLITRAMTSRYDDARKDFTDMKEDFADAALIVRKSLGHVPSVAREDLGKFVETYRSTAQDLLDQSGAILSRAKRNGRGIVRRVQQLLKEKKVAKEVVDVKEQ